MIQQENTKLNFAGQEIYVGLDTGKKSWRVSILILLCHLRYVIQKCYAGIFPFTVGHKYAKLHGCCSLELS